MLCLTRCLHSLALTRATPFTVAATRVVDLHRRHRELMNNKADGDDVNVGDINNELHRIEREMDAAVDTLRPVFNAAASLEVARFYSVRLYAALRYFGMTEDPVFAQLQRIIGKARNTPTSSGLRAAAPRRRAAIHADPEQRVQPIQFKETHPSFNPEELPAPPPENIATDLPADASIIHDAYRGHWVLRDPDIAITARGRKMDPW